MASNEHAYLSEPNLHNPKGLSLATNDTLCSKSNSGQLEWVSKSYIKTDTIVNTGYCTLAVNYKYPSATDNNSKAPFDMNQDYGSPVISSETVVNQSTFFKIFSPCASQDAVINRCRIQVTNNGNEESTFYVALVKYTPINSSTTVYPTVLFEKEVQGLDSNHIVMTTDLVVPTDFTNTNISKGDHIFIMAKAVVNGEITSVGSVSNITVITELGYSTN